MIPDYPISNPIVLKQEVRVLSNLIVLKQDDSWLLYIQSNSVKARGACMWTSLYHKKKIDSCMLTLA